MNPRERRLRSDLRQLLERADGGGFSFRADGDPPERYEVLVSAAGLALTDGRPAVRRLHRFELYLHLDYPRRPPVVRWQTPVFHPNLLGPERNGGVCIGSWSAAESLADLCERLVALVAWRAFNAADALDPEAAAWALAHAVEAGDDVAELARLPLVRDEIRILAGGGENA